MLRRIAICCLLIQMLGFVFSNPSASFFGKKKVDEKQHVEQKRVNKKAFVVEIYASWCPYCKNIQPTLDLLAKQDEEVRLIQFDVSTASKAEASEKLAKDLKLDSFYKAVKSKTATVAVIVPSSLEIISLFENNNDIGDYRFAIQKAKAKELEFVSGQLGQGS